MSPLAVGPGRRAASASARARLRGRAQTQPYGNRFWLQLRKQTECFGFLWPSPEVGELGGEHLRTQVCCLLPGQVGLPEGEDWRQVGRASWEGQPGRACLHSCQWAACECTPHRSWRVRAGHLSYRSPYTSTCLQAACLRCARASLLPPRQRGQWESLNWALCCSCCLLTAPYIPGIMIHSLYFVSNSHVDSSGLTGVGVVSWPTSQMRKQERGNCSRPPALKLPSRCRTQARVCRIQSSASRLLCSAAFVWIVDPGLNLCSSNDRPRICRQIS